MAVLRLWPQNSAGVGQTMANAEDKEDTMENRLQEYARLVVEVGVNVQRGQNLIIAAPVECAGFARL